MCEAQDGLMARLPGDTFFRHQGAEGHMALTLLEYPRYVLQLCRPACLLASHS